MVVQSLSTDEGLRAACEAIGDPRTWEVDRREWVQQLTETIEWVHGSPLAERSTRDFQQRRWERNHVAAVGQGNIPLDKALDDETFRSWLAGKSIEPLPGVSDVFVRPAEGQTRSGGKSCSPLEDLSHRSGQRRRGGPRDPRQSSLKSRR